MALASRAGRFFESISKGLRLVKYNGVALTSRSYTDASLNKRESQERDPAVFFFDSRIQRLLNEIATSDISKVFLKRREGQSLSTPKVMFLTQEELDEEIEKAEKRAAYYLQMPPILLPRKEIKEIISQDPELQGLNESKYVFTDISYGVPSHERLIVSRDPDGTLRHAYWNERDRMNQAYFPSEGRTMHVPKMFSDPQLLKSLLDKFEYEFVLDRACVQFEPDDPVYIDIVSTVYNHIDQNQKYDAVRGSRHFGSMLFYLVFNGKQDNVLLHCISSYSIGDAVNIINVYYIINSEAVFTPAANREDTNFVTEYIEKYSLPSKRSTLKRSFQTLMELQFPHKPAQSVSSG